MISGGDTGLEWTVRHGRSVALTIALKEAADRLMAEEWGKRVIDTVLSNANADRVRCSYILTFPSFPG